LFFAAVLSVPNTHRNSGLGNDHPDSSLPQEGQIKRTTYTKKAFHFSRLKRGISYISKVLLLEHNPSSMDLLMSQIHQLDTNWKQIHKYQVEFTTNNFPRIFGHTLHYMLLCDFNEQYVVAFWKCFNYVIVAI